MAISLLTLMWDLLSMALIAVGAVNMPPTLCSSVSLKNYPGSGVFNTGAPCKERRVAGVLIHGPIFTRVNLPRAVLWYHSWTRYIKVLLIPQRHGYVARLLLPHLALAIHDHCLLSLQGLPIFEAPDSSHFPRQVWIALTTFGLYLMILPFSVLQLADVST